MGVVNFSSDGGKQKADLARYQPPDKNAAPKPADANSEANEEQRLEPTRSSDGGASDGPFGPRRLIMPRISQGDLARIREKVPQALRERQIWVCADRTPKPSKDGKKSGKAPLWTGGNASSTSPSTWMTFDQAVELARQDDRVGALGIMLGDQQLVAVDLDHVLDEHGQLAPEAQAFIEQMPPTYAEVSPGRDGLHLVYMGAKPDGLGSSVVLGEGMNLECWDSGRYVTITGHRVESHLWGERVQEHEAVIGELGVEKLGEGGVTLAQRMGSRKKRSATADKCRAEWHDGAIEVLMHCFSDEGPWDVNLDDLQLSKWRREGCWSEDDGRTAETIWMERVMLAASAHAWLKQERRHEEADELFEAVREWNLDWADLDDNWEERVDSMFRTTRGESGPGKLYYELEVEFDCLEGGIRGELGDDLWRRLLDEPTAKEVFEANPLDEDEVERVIAEAGAAQEAQRQERAEQERQDAKPYRTCSDIKLIERPMSLWVVHGYMREAYVGLVAAESGAGKSAGMLDGSLRMVHGMDWLGRRTTPGSVLWFAGEGKGSIGARSKGWRTEHDMPLDVAGRDGHELVVVDERIDAMSAPAGMARLEATFLAESQRLGHKPQLVVLDTMSTIWRGENESDNAEVARWIAELKAFAEKHLVVVAIVHHVAKLPQVRFGKKTEEGDQTREITLDSIRGATALVADVDFVIALAKVQGGGFDLLNLKQRDGALTPPLRFHLKVHDLGRDANGDPITAPVPVMSGSPSAAMELREEAKKEKARADDEELLRKLLQAVIDHGGQLETATAIVTAAKVRRGDGLAGVRRAKALGYFDEPKKGLFVVTEKGRNFAVVFKTGLHALQEPGPE